MKNPPMFVLVPALLAMSAIVAAQQAGIHGQGSQQAPVVEAWPMQTTGELSLLVARERFRIYTDHCASEIPSMRASFEDVMQVLQMRIRSIGMRLLDTPAFQDMKQQAVSEPLLGTLSAELADIRQDLEDQDPELVCAGTLQSYREYSDALLEDFLKRTLAGVRITDQGLKSGNSR